MHARRVRTLEDVEVLRQLRNEARKQMTGSTKLIRKRAQAKWWAEAERRAWLFVDNNGRAVGFAYVKRESGRNWITLGVTKDFRGQGIGTLIYHSLRPCWARIREDNEASLTAARRAGYVAVETEDGTVVMKG